MSATKVLVSALLVFYTCVGFAQIAGKKSKKPYLACDDVEYKVGDIIRLGVPANGRVYEQIKIFQKTSFLDYATVALGTLTDISNVSSTSSLLSGGFEDVDKSFMDKTAIIKSFSFFNPKGKPDMNSVFVIAKMVDAPYENIAFEINLALKNGELFSNNPNYAKAITDKEPVQEGILVTQFSPKIHTEFLKAVGSKDQQIVTFELLMSHKQVHQTIGVKSGDCSLYDMEGNEYKGSYVRVGSVESSYQAENKIPTEVPVKVYITFNKLLPSVEKARFVSVKVAYNNAVDYFIYEYAPYGILELKNVPIDWK